MIKLQSPWLFPFLFQFEKIFQKEEKSRFQPPQHETKKNKNKNEE